MKKPDITTLGGLREIDYPHRTVKDEIRNNLLAALVDGKKLFPGIVGYDETVIPELTNAILARHDFILLGLRGQAKTRILRGLVDLLDPWIPVVRGSEIHDHPYTPTSAAAQRMIEQGGEDTEIEWIPRELRYHEKLATPDVTIADLIGDIDPVKAAKLKLSFSSLDAIHYGLIPRANRGIFAVNELPDLQPRIQVGLLNIMQEKDIQIRGFPVRLSLDLCMVFTANPEDYTNRGTIITPLKDRIDSQILTHYPRTLPESEAITDQEAWVERDGVTKIFPDYLRDAIERIAFEARESDYVDQASGVSARLPITAMECVVSNLERRAAKTGEKQSVARISDLAAAVPAITGKIELVYEGEQEGPLKVARYLIGRAVKAAFEARLPEVHPRRSRREKEEERPPEASSPYRPILDWFSSGTRLEVSDTMTAEEHQELLAAVPGLEDLARKHLGVQDGPELGAAMEFILEGLHQSSVLAKEDVEGRKVFLDMFQTMFSALEEN
jgi:magnesium chelatase subunit I